MDYEQFMGEKDRQMIDLWKDGNEMVQTGIILLWNQGDKGGIESSQDGFVQPRVLHNPYNILVDNIPTSFEEIYIESIRTQSLTIFHFLEDFTDLFFGNWSVKIAVILSGNQLGDILYEVLDERVPV